MKSAKYIWDIVEFEISRITDVRIARRIRELLVPPHPVERGWDYGAPGDHFTCWTILEHPETNTGIAFCSEGFGPNDPWGLVFLTGPNQSIGMDCSWYVSLEEAMRNSRAWDGPNPEGYESR